MPELKDELKAALREVMAELKGEPSPPQSPQPVTLTETDKAAIAAAQGAGITQPSHISDTRTSLDPAANDIAVMQIQLHRHEALLAHLFNMFQRGADLAKIVSDFDATRAGSEVLDPSAKGRG